MMRLFELIKSIVHPTDAASGKRKRSFPTNERLVKKKKYSCTLCGKEGKDKRHPDCPFRNFKTPPGRFNQLISVWNFPDFLYYRKLFRKIFQNWENYQKISVAWEKRSWRRQQLLLSSYLGRESSQSWESSFPLGTK